MKKSDIFDRVVDIVADECEVARRLIINDRRIHAVVEARCMCVYILKQVGFTSKDVALIVIRLQDKGMIDPGYCPSAERLSSKARTIDELYSSFFERYARSYSFRLMYADIKKAILSEYKDVAALLEIRTN